MWNILKATKHVFTVNGHTVHGTVTVQWAYEDSYPMPGVDFDFGSKAENEAYYNKFVTQALSNVVISVIVRGEGLEGIDTLGQVHVRNNGRFGGDILQSVKDHDMVENATDECIVAIMEAAHKLQRFNQVKGA